MNKNRTIILFLAPLFLMSSAGFGGLSMRVYNTDRDHAIKVQIVCPEKSPPPFQMEKNGVFNLVLDESGCKVLKGIDAVVVQDPDPSPAPSPHSLMTPPLIQCHNLDPNLSNEMELVPGQINDLIVSNDGSGHFSCTLGTGE